MSYIIGNLTLPNPIGFTRKQIETGASVNTLGGQTKKDIIARKEQYVLTYELLSQAVIATILTEYNLKIARYFSVNETNLTINPTLVHIEIAERQYNTKGNEYREDLTLVLTEVE